MEILTVDIGGTFIKYALMNEHMDILDRGKVKTPIRGREALVEAIGQLYDAMPQVEGIAISMPGIIDSDNGYCLMGGALRYNDGFYLQHSLYRRCPVKIHKEIAVQIFNIQTLLDPQCFAIGGGVSSQPLFIEHI